MSKGKYLGNCIYCNTEAIIEVEDDLAHEYNEQKEEFQIFLNEEATKICKCASAVAWWNVERCVRKAEKRCEEIAGGKIGQALKEAVRPIMSNKFESITIKHCGNKYSVYLDNNDGIHIKRECKVIDDNAE